MYDIDKFVERYKKLTGNEISIPLRDLTALWQFGLEDVAGCREHHGIMLREFSYYEELAGHMIVLARCYPADADALFAVLLQSFEMAPMMRELKRRHDGDGEEIDTHPLDLSDILA